MSALVSQDQQKPTESGLQDLTATAVAKASFRSTLNSFLLRHPRAAALLLVVLAFAGTSNAPVSNASFDKNNTDDDTTTVVVSSDSIAKAALANNDVKVNDAEPNNKPKVKPPLSPAAVKALERVGQAELVYYDPNTASPFLQNIVFSNFTRGLSRNFRTQTISDTNLFNSIRKRVSNAEIISGDPNRTAGLGVVSNLSNMFIMSALPLKMTDKAGNLVANVQRDYGIYNTYMHTGSMSPAVEVDVDSNFASAVSWAVAAVEDCGDEMTEAEDLFALVVEVIQQNGAGQYLVDRPVIVQHNIVRRIARVVDAELQLGIEFPADLPLSREGDIYHSADDFDQVYWQERGCVEHCAGELEFLASLLRVNAETLAESKAGRELLDHLPSLVQTVTLERWVAGVLMEKGQRHQVELPTTAEYIHSRYAEVILSVIDPSKDPQFKKYLQHFDAEFFVQTRELTDAGAFTEFVDAVDRMEIDQAAKAKPLAEYIPAYRVLSILAKMNPSVFEGDLKFSDSELAQAHHKWDGDTSLQAAFYRLQEGVQTFNNPKFDTLAAECFREPVAGIDDIDLQPLFRSNNAVAAVN